jgi:uncharacterized hydrophobic protein (TIGR00271 family)
MVDKGEVAEVVEEVASEKLGVGSWDRPTIYRESADAASDNRLPYWAVLTLSGAIATLGLALDSAAVVIGAMLVAPLLAPVIGLALSLAIGDGRLAVQTMAIVLASTIAVIVVGAALSVVLPFHSITPEIAARTRPTTLDLVIAVFSGLVGAVVTVARRSRLSASIPGVAIAVALIPPLAVTGFGVGIRSPDLIRGSLLLYGANLAGIVLSGMAVFLLIGMHRPEVLETARTWHRQAETHGIAAWADRIRWVRTLGVFRSAWARVGLVVAFAISLGFPLSASLAQITRETRVERAVRAAEREVFHRPGEASIIGRQVEIGAERTQVYLRVATMDWFGVDEREEFERLASARAGEPITLSLEQLPTRGNGSVASLNTLAGGQAPPDQAQGTTEPIHLADLLGSARERLDEAIQILALPAEVEIVEAELTVGRAGHAVVRMTYAAPRPLAGQAEEMLALQLRRVIEVPDIELQLRHMAPARGEDGAIDPRGPPAGAVSP